VIPVKISRTESPKFSNGEDVVYAADQPEYYPLPTIRFPSGLVVSKWEPTMEERFVIANGGNIYLGLMTFNNPLQPILLGTLPEDIVG
jgi:hypothetical protein